MFHLEDLLVVFVVDKDYVIFLKTEPTDVSGPSTLINENIVKMEMRSPVFNTLFKKSSAP